MAAFEDEIGSFEAKTRLSELLRECERGRSFVINRRGKPVARLIPPGRGEEEDESDLASLAGKLREVRERIDEKVDVRSLVKEGRRH